jgi:starch synthase (maltosyl-transferring)
MRDPARAASILIEAVSPELDGGRSAVKRIAGDVLRIEADVLTEGHDVLAATAWWRRVSPKAEAGAWQAVPMRPLGNDRWAADVPLPAPGRLVFTVEAWPDLFRSWVSQLERQVAAGREVQSELLEGAALLVAAAERARAAGEARDAERLERAAVALKAGPPGGIPVAVDPELATLAARHPDLSVGRRDPLERPVLVGEPIPAPAPGTSSFRGVPPMPSDTGRSATSEQLLPDIEAMGFDVLYSLHHPIGRTARKGKNNAPRAGAGDLGSPWAIGAAEGGHTAVHPELGSVDDFRRLVARAAEHGLEVALDLAFQASPDHPWIREHPEWFQHRPDGTIKTAENPPKRYDDIVNFDFLGPGRTTLWPALRDVVLFWVTQGVRLFRVDNPHTKPLAFWEWLLTELRERDPTLVFLSEAFTRPKLQRALGKVGFSQTYTYFTWRNGKQELIDYFRELARRPGPMRCAPTSGPTRRTSFPSSSSGRPPAFGSGWCWPPPSAPRGVCTPVSKLCDGAVLRARSTATRRSTSWSTGGPGCGAISGPWSGP